MIMPGSKAYEIKCLSCDWHKLEIERDCPIPLGNLGGKKKVPKKCPECGGKVVRNDNVVVGF